MCAQVRLIQEIVTGKGLKEIGTHEIISAVLLSCFIA